MLKLAARGRIALTVIAATSLLTATALCAQAPPPKPKEDRGQESNAPPPKPTRRPGPAAPPPPTLVVSSDTDCTLELDGEYLGDLEKDVVREFRIREGEHLLQAFPKGVEEGPTWKDTVKAPETGNVVATVELRKVIEEWQKKSASQGRFEERGEEVADLETGLVWAHNVSPAMPWEDARGYCQAKTIAGKRGWRLPTVDELSKLYFPDHPAPKQESTGGDSHWTIFGKRTSDIEVLPRMIFQVFDHNSVGALWVSGNPERVACSFLGEFNCEVERKKSSANILCVRAGEAGE